MNLEEKVVSSQTNCGAACSQSGHLNIELGAVVSGNTYRDGHSIVLTLCHFLRSDSTPFILISRFPVFCFEHFPSSPSLSAWLLFFCRGDILQSFHLFPCYLGIATEENDASNYFGSNFHFCKKRKKKRKGASGSTKNIMKAGLKISSQGVIFPQRWQRAIYIYFKMISWSIEEKKSCLLPN